jgi:hypothetical protein
LQLFPKRDHWWAHVAPDLWHQWEDDTNWRICTATLRSTEDPIKTTILGNLYGESEFKKKWVFVQAVDHGIVWSREFRVLSPTHYFPHTIYYWLFIIDYSLFFIFVLPPKEVLWTKIYHYVNSMERLPGKK